MAKCVCVYVCVCSFPIFFAAERTDGEVPGREAGEEGGECNVL